MPRHSASLKRREQPACQSTRLNKNSVEQVLWSQSSASKHRWSKIIHVRSSVPLPNPGEQRFDMHVVISTSTGHQSLTKVVLCVFIKYSVQAGLARSTSTEWPHRL